MVPTERIWLRKPMAELRPDVPNTSELSDFRPDWCRKGPQVGSVGADVPMEQPGCRRRLGSRLESRRLEWSHRPVPHANRQLGSEFRMGGYSPRKSRLLQGNRICEIQRIKWHRMWDQVWMLAIEATNVGVGFWVTDEGSWNAKKLPANTSGRLYVWNGSNLGIEVYALYLPSFAKPVAKGIGTDSIITTATGALTGRCQAAQRSSFTSVKERSSASTVTSRPRFWRSRPGTVPIGPPTPDYVRPLAGGYWIDFCKAANSKSWQCRSADRVAWTGT